jgi:hypothetical protein
MSNLVAVYGGKAFERKIAHTTVTWCIKKLLPRLRTLDITIRFKNFSDGSFADCSPNALDVLCGYNPRAFEIRVQKGLKLFDLLTTLCHEMVHVKQYAKKELVDVYHGACYTKTLWKKSPKNWENAEYRELPWEKEAWKLERPMAILCLEEAHSDYYG